MFTPEALNNFYAALSVTIKGMAGIFIFMLMFFVIIRLLDIIFPQKHPER
jgi:Na+-transporting methylmalonyl-CoA/oxaloacetate decarboxylase gamma subunit